ncbi:RNA helicase [Malassezia sp. CBS 17886]|nr:RNA helicase [Malassezia sp. CBS 17886]
MAKRPGLTDEELDDLAVFVRGGACWCDTPDAQAGAAMGVIERVDMINFMCHRHLSIQLGPRINFIIGHNGSGKSAILTAIMVALGGKAATTSRGSSLRDFIREGASAAEVRIHIRNTGPDAYRADAYGSQIVIERRIGSDGSGAWKIRGASAKIVSTKREELNTICDHANIQVDNPINILSQDAARQFLGSSQAEDKYNFFLRGTQLSQLAQEYELIQTNVQRMKRAMARTEDLLPDLEREAREANAKWELVEQARAEQEKLNSLKDELVWSQVIAKEQELAAQAEKLERARAKEGALQQKRDAEQAQATALDTEIAALEERGSEYTAREHTLRDAHAAAVDRARERRAALSAAKTQEKEISVQADRVQQTVQHLQRQIDDEAHKLAQGRRARRESQEARRDALAQERLENEIAQTHARAMLDEAGTQREALAQERAGAEGELRRLAEKREHLDRFLARCEAATADRITAFGGPGVPQVMAAIARERRWRQPPAGPLGMRIRVRDMRWAPVVEAVLGGTLNAFCVTNHADRALLAAILRRFRAPNQIITATPELFDYADGEPDASVLTILRVLDVDDPYIVRALINSQNVEKAALVPARADGDVLVRRHLRNVQQCFSADLFRIAGGPTGSSTQTVTKYAGVPRFAGDNAAAVQEASLSRTAIDAQQQRVRGRLDELETRERALRDELRAGETRLAALRERHRVLRQQVAQMEEEMREDVPANVAALEEARQDAEAEMPRIVDQFRAVEARKEEAQHLLQPHDAETERLRSQLEILGTEKNDIEAELQRVFSARVRLRKNDEHWAAQLGTQQSGIAEAQGTVDTLSAQLDEWSAQATAYCARVETQRSAEWLEKQISTIEAQIHEARRSSGLSLEAVVRDMRTKNKAYQNAQQQLENTRQTIETLDHAILVRLEKWHYFRRYVAMRARASFAMHLQNRGFSGSLHFDHNAQQLRLRVQTGDRTQPYDKDPKALSGGEKSFATICLLLALWEAIGCPIRCLDEFDVFMDAVNRKVSMRMLIEAARASAGVQYVLITPQSMTNIALGPEVQVHRMLDPERGGGEEETRG